MTNKAKSNPIRGFLLIILWATALWLPATAAQAIDARTAIRMCEVNPNCEFSVDDGGWVDIVVGGDDVIGCPPTGECTCVDCDPPARVGSTGSKKIFGPNAVSKILK